MRDDDLESAFAGRPFTAADLRAAGLPPGAVRRVGLATPVRGVRTTVPVDRTTVLRGLDLVLPEPSAFSHTTAAALHGLPLTRALERRTEVHVTAPTGTAMIRRSGVVGHRGLERRSVTRRDGLPVVDAADTWADLASLTPRLTVDDLVVVGDAVVASVDARLAGRTRWDASTGLPVDPRSPGLDERSAVLGARRGGRGRRALAAALDLVRPRSASPMETRSRLMFVRAGFPEPVMNAPVFADGGGWLLLGDLVWHSARVVGEYQGADHGSIRRRSADASRAAAAADHGWRVVEIFAEDVRPGVRHRDCLLRFAREMRLDPRTLQIPR